MRSASAAAREALAAEIAHRIETERAETRAATLAADPPDYTRGLTAVQSEALSVCDEPLALLWGRRTGKTYCLPRMLLRAAEEPGSWSAYITKTRGNAKKLLWRWLKRAARDLRIPHRTNESELVLDVAGGGSILMGGADKIDSIERYRQFGWKLAILDEMGTYPDALAITLIDDVIEPATMDYRGQIVYSGTPGYVPDGRWHELSGPDSEIRVIRADARSNTAIPGLWDRILEKKAANGWDDDHPTWQREYLARWVPDASTLVYPYDAARNAVSGLPTHTPGGVPLHASGWRYVLGADVGYVHACAFVLTCCHELDPHDYVVSAEKHGELLPDGFSAIVASYLERYPGLRIVVDTGGMGKIHAAWTGFRERLPGLLAADKRDKPSAIRDLRGRLLSGRVKVLDGQQCAPLRGEMLRLAWAKDHLHHADGQEDHACDALLYALRELRNLGQVPAEGPPRSPKDLLEEKLLEQRIAEVAGNGRPWWDA